MTQHNKKMLQRRNEEYWCLRSYHRAARGNKGPRYLIKCGCCEEKVEIYYDEETLEINGVLGSLENWREILLPLLQGEGLNHNVESKKP